MSIKKMLTNDALKNLPPEEFKSLFLLIDKSTDNHILNFTIRGLVRDWNENQSLNMPTSKNKIKDIIRYLEKEKMIKYDKKNETLHILIKP